MNYFNIEPEVAGQLGNLTVSDESVHPPKINQLHYVFDGWCGDDLLESFPVYIITDRLKNKITESNLSGYSVDSVIISKSEQFKELYPQKELPNFVWLKIIGTAYKDDFGINDELKK